MSRQRTGEQFALVLGLLIGVTGCSEFGIEDPDSQVGDPVVIEENFEQEPLPKVDVLWVVDNTASMAAEQIALQEAVGPFVEALQEAGVAWQLGVVSTDISDAHAGVLQGVPWIITPNLEDPAGKLAQAVEVGLDGLAPAAGLAAAQMALLEPLRSAENRGFRRSDAALQIIFVSDGDDDSAAAMGEAPAEVFLELVDEEATQTGHPVTVSAVVGDAGTGCTGPGGTAQPGTTYLAVATATGGATASICDSDLRPITFDIATEAVQWADAFLLAADPVSGTVRVSVDTVRRDDGWELLLDPPTIRFDDPPAPGSEITVRYTVQEP